MDAFVEEEDTFLALSADVALRLPGEHPVRVMTGAREAEEAGPGALVVRHRAGEPLLFLAVVHKLDERPSFREGWIAEALDAVGREAARRELRALALPLLGTVYGTFDPVRSLELTREALLRAPTLERIWLVAGTERNDA